MADSDGPLAAVVAKPRAEAAIDALRTEGVYDNDRRVRERDAETVELPVTDAPAETRCRAVVTGAPERRHRGLADRLRERGWSADAVAAAPGSWAVVGDVVVADLSGLDDDRRRAVAEELRDLHGAATVLHRRGIEGPHREPDVEVVLGERTRTVHVEHGTEYALDLADVMFSPGNQAERARMGRVVAADEHVLDMFAGIGYFALPAARAGATVTAVERNPAAHDLLVENARRNGVEDRLTAIRGDCREVAPTVERSADRIVMGHFDAAAYLDAALAALAPDGRLHLHATVHERDDGRPLAQLADAADAANRSVETSDRRRVKSYGEGVSHVVVDATVA